MKTTEDLLNKYGKALVKKIQDNIDATGSTATGRTKESVQYAIEGNTLVVFSDRPYFKAIETGSKPSTKNPSPQMVESLTEWAQAKSVQAPPQAIAKSILKHGSKLWQKGGRKDIYSNAWDEVKEEFYQDLKTLEVDKGRVHIHGS